MKKETRIHAFEMKSYRELLGIHYTEHKTNEFVMHQIRTRAREQELLLVTAKRRKLSWFGHVNRHDTLAKTTLQVWGKNMGDNVKEWTGLDLNTLLVTTTDCRMWDI